MRKAIISIIVLIISQSCRKEPTPYYPGGRGLFFKTDSSSSEIAFGEQREFVTDSVIWGKVYLFGPLLNETTSFRLQADENSTALAGRDYELPSSFTFKADSLQDTVFIHILRSPAILDDTLTLVLRLIPDAAFPVTWQEGGDQLYTMTFTIEISDHINKPQEWDDAAKYYGTYSEKKLRLLISLFDPRLSVHEITDQLKFQAEAKSYQLKKYLKEQQAAGKPVYETDGSLMEAGPDAPENY